MTEPKVQPRKGCHPAPCLADFNMSGAEHALDDRLDYLRFPKPDIGHQIQNLAGRPQPIIVRDKVLKGGDGLGPREAEASYQEMTHASSDGHSGIFGQLRQRRGNQCCPVAGRIVDYEVAQDGGQLAPRAVEAIVKDVATIGRLPVAPLRPAVLCRAGGVQRAVRDDLDDVVRYAVSMETVWARALH